MNLWEKYLTSLLSHTPLNTPVFYKKMETLSECNNDSRVVMVEVRGKQKGHLFMKPRQTPERHVETVFFVWKRQHAP